MITLEELKNQARTLRAALPDPKTDTINFGDLETHLGQFNALAAQATQLGVFKMVPTPLVPRKKHTDLTTKFGIVIAQGTNNMQVEAGLSKVIKDIDLILEHTS